MPAEITYRNGLMIRRSRAKLGAYALVLGFLLPNPALDPVALSARLFAAPAAGAAITSASQGFHAAKLKEIDEAIQAAIAEKRCPGGVLWMERGGTAYHRAYGQRAVVPSPELMTEDTLFDAASLTKVIATTPSIMLLHQRGKLDLDATVDSLIPGFKANGKDAVRVRHLLTHTSGLRPGLVLTTNWSGWDRAIELACAEKPMSEPGTVFRYSDINFIVLGEVVRRVSGKSLDTFAAEEVFKPLQMVDTGFKPSQSRLARIAPTEVADTDSKPFRGVVHDPTSRRMGGVAGHAGLFTTASDLARFARMMLNGGSLDGVTLFTPKTVALMTSVQTQPGVEARRGLGWDIDSPYAGPRGELFPVGSFGHTGWTGTSIWMDPFSRTFVIFLSNRNHPTEQGNVIALRRRIGTLAAEAVPDFNFSFVPGALPSLTSEGDKTTPARIAKPAQVLNGIDVLTKDGFAPLKDLRIGLITNHTGHDRERKSTIDLLRAAPGVKLLALFSPEHGIRGALDEKVPDGTDSQTGLPVFSLYGETRQPKPEQLQGLDALVFDIQDIGCRFYTYISTMELCMEAAAKAGIRFFVLDRVNPIGGRRVEGPLSTGRPSFTACHPIPVRHGMTIGELAQMFNQERKLNAKLTVIRLQGWSRGLWFDQDSLPWTNPSPNMRSLTEAALYPGIGLLETTALSVGRGTGTPFEIIGAPYIEDVRFAEALNRLALPGVRFVPVRFTPTASVYKDQPCAGVQIALLDRENTDVVPVGVAIACTLHRMYPKEFDVEKFDRLLVHKPTIEAIRTGKPWSEIQKGWVADLEEFQKRRAPFLIYN